MLKDGWKPAYDKAKYCKYYLKRYNENQAEFIEAIYQKLGKLHSEMKAKHGENLGMEYVVLKVCLPDASGDFMIPNIKEMFENADKQAAAALENTANPSGQTA